MLNDILPRLDKVRQVGSDRYMACCPAHDDKTPSMTITDTGDKVLVHCFAGCSTAEIIDAMGAKWKDLYPEDTDFYRSFADMPKLPEPDPLRVEENICLIAQSKIERGEELSMEEQARVEVAIENVRCVRGYS